jgi:hypothetical protein
MFGKKKRGLLSEKIDQIDELINELEDAIEEIIGCKFTNNHPAVRLINQRINHLRILKRKLIDGAIPWKN